MQRSSGEEVPRARTISRPFRLHYCQARGVKGHGQARLDATNRLNGVAQSPFSSERLVTLDVDPERNHVDWAGRLPFAGHLHFSLLKSQVGILVSTSSSFLFTTQCPQKHRAVGWIRDHAGSTAEGTPWGPSGCPKVLPGPHLSFQSPCRISLSTDCCLLCGRKTGSVVGLTEGDLAG